MASTSLRAHKPTLKGKDLLLPGSYRSISLIDVDTKILLKIIASRLALLLLTVLHQAQSGFVPGRSATLNICKVFLAVEHARAHSDQGMAISLDAEKA